VASSHGIGATPLHLQYLLSAVADIDAKFLAARLTRREPAECAGTSINTRRQGRSLLFRDSVLPSDLGQRLSKSAENCRNGKKYVAGRLKHHGSSNGCLPTGVRDEFPGKAEGRSAESAKAGILCRKTMRDADVRRVVPFTFKRSAIPLLPCA
jgi:hypothetical protein